MDVHTEELAAPAGRDEERGAVVVTFAVVFAAVELVWVAAIVYAALRLF